MQVRDICTTHVACCTPEMTLQEAAKMMVECDCGAIPVVDSKESKQPVGIITDRDIACRAVAEGKNPQETRVEECMSRNLATIREDASIEECCETMERAKVRRILVEDEQGNLCGILSQADIALHLSQSMTGELVGQVSEPSDQPSQSQ